MKENIKFYIENKNITHAFIYQLMNGNLVSSFRKIDDPILFIKENYESVLVENVADGYLVNVVKELYDYPMIREFMDEMFFVNIKHAQNSEIGKLVKVYLSNKNKKEQVEFLKSRFSKLLEFIDPFSFYQIYDCKDLDLEFRELLNQKIKNNKQDFVRYFIHRFMAPPYNTEEHYENLVFFVERMIEEILQNEKLDWIDIKEGQSGYYSDTLEIGSKILKLGRERGTYHIPYDKRILLPLVRFNLSDFNDDVRYYGVVEVDERVKTDVFLEEEVLYYVYRDMRDRGIICTDIKRSNVGILLKDNRKYWNLNIGHSLRAVGLMEENVDCSIEILKTGDYVLIDTDFVFLEDDPKIVWPQNSLSPKFERIYQQSKMTPFNKIDENACIPKGFKL